MTARWVSPGDTAPDALARVQGSLTVDMIMTPPADLQTCRRDEIAGDVADRNTKKFSYLPVMDGKERILGLYEAARWFTKKAPRQAIGDDFQVFSEDIVIGADASIVDFVRRADERPTRLVVSGDQVAGLVSLSDLQQLPVRAALFTLITRLEMTMADRIEQEWDTDNGAGWLEALGEDRRRKIEKAIDGARAADGFVSEIAFSQLADKATIMRKNRLIAGSATSLKHDFNAIVELRDYIAHASHYAETPRMARKVCSTVRTILRIQKELSLATATEQSAPAIEGGHA